MRRRTVMCKGKKYIMVATATGKRFARIIVVTCLLLCSMSISAKTIRVFTRDIVRIEETVKNDGNTYTITLKNGTVYFLEDKAQYDLVRENWQYFMHLNLKVKSNEEE